MVIVRGVRVVGDGMVCVVDLGLYGWDVVFCMLGVDGGRVSMVMFVWYDGWGFWSGIGWGGCVCRGFCGLLGLVVLG